MVNAKELDSLDLSPIEMDAAKRFIKDNESLMIDKLRSDFIRWNVYVPKSVDIRKMNYKQFLSTIQRNGEKGLAPHPIYDDGNLSISEFKSWNECELFPIENSFCVCNNPDKIENYKNLGIRVFLICDKSKLLTNDVMRIAGCLLKNGEMRFWNSNDIPCGTTSDRDGAMMNYINSLPSDARTAILNLIEESKTNENKTYKNMKKNVQRINESQLRAIVAESVKKMLTEATDDLPEAIEMQDKFAEAILFKLRELETFWWEKHKTPYPYSREVLKKALKGYDWEHKQGGEGLEYCGFER